MKQSWLRLVCVAACLAGAGQLPAAEQHLEFLRGLRERQYFDYAQMYLNDIEDRADVPADIKRVIPYERAVTLLEESRNVRSPDSRRELLEQAQAMFEQFVSQNPTDPRTADANHERAAIFLERAKVALLEAKLPTTDKRKAETLRDQARTAVGKAREVYQAAYTQYEEAWKKFPTYIDEKDKAQRAAREEAEKKYLQAKIDVALATYWESQTYLPEEPAYQQTLTDAANQFEKIHSDHRSQVVGLYARMWQGRCFEEMAQYGPALGIYNELLGHPGESQPMQALQDQVLQFKLSVLNRQQDYQLAMDFATAWLENRNNRARSRTPIGVGIQYQRAIAREEKAIKLDEFDPERKKLLEMALADARVIRNFPYEYKDPAVFMEQRIKTALGEEAKDPENFNDAVVLVQTLQSDADNLKSDIEALDQQIAAAKTNEEKEQKRAERQKLDRERLFKLSEAARVLQIGLRLAGPDVKPEQLDNARATLAYLYWQAGRNYEAAVLGEFLGRRLKESNPEIAQQTAFIAMAAYSQEYSAVSKDESSADKGEFEINRMAQVAEYITSTWPTSDRATQSRNLLGKIYEMQDQPLKAAQNYAQVPEANVGAYADAQLRAGQSYWKAYLNAGRLPENEKPTQEQLDEWTTKAGQHLQTGLDKKAIPADAVPAPDYVAAKLTLAQIKYNAKQYDEALDILTKAPHAVMQSIAVKEGESRPKIGIQSVPFATEAYRVLLFTQIGKQQTDAALKTLDDLEKIVPPDQQDMLNQVYLSLGRQLREELDRLWETDQKERFDQVLASFDQFLGALFQRKENLSYSQINWVAASYYSLGETLDGRNARSGEYFQKAGDAYQSMLARAQADPEFAPNQGKSMSGIRMRLAESQMRQQQYEEAVGTITEVVKEKPNALDAQFKAAEIYQAWGAAGGADAEQHFNTAVNGDKAKGVWGLAEITNRMRNQIQRGQEQLRNEFYDALVRKARARQQWANQAGGPKQTKILQGAKIEIESFASLNDPRKISDEWWAKLDTTYQDIQRDMNIVPPEPLKKAEGFSAADAVAAAPATPDTPADTATTATTPVQAAAVPSAAQPDSSSPLGMIIGVVLLLAVVGGTIWVVMVMRKQPKRRPLHSAPAGNPFAGGPPSGNGPSAASARPRTAASAKTGTAAVTKPAARPQTKTPGQAAPTQTRAAKPRPTE